MNRLRIIQVDGAPNALEIELRPPDGMVWHVIDAFGIHDDTTSRQIQWAYIDGNIGMSKGPTAAVAAGTRVPITVHAIAEGSSISSPLILNHQIWAKLIVGTLTAGKLMKIRALVRETDEDIL